MNRNKLSKKNKKNRSKSRGGKNQRGLKSLLWSARPLYQKFILSLICLFLIIVGGSYGVAYWYQQKHRHEPLVVGTTFIADYARFFGLSAKETLNAIITDLDVKHLRLVSYWKDIEKQPGVYDFSDLDWQIKMADQANVPVTLSLGIRQPRWPECHQPEWANNIPKEQWQPKLMDFISATVNRYKNNPSIQSYQIENEYFMTAFGECKDYDKQRFLEEVELVKKLDPGKPIIITRSNNWGGFPVNKPTPDVFGVAVYKRVYDYSITHRYFEYPYPPWFYASLAGAGELYSGKPLIIHELQTEPWMPEGYFINKLSDIPEQNKSMDANRLKHRFKYAEDTGLRSMDTWGAEWWYWRKEKANDPSLWNTAKQEINRLNYQNSRIR